MECAAKNPHCTDTTQHRVFLWRYQRIKNIILPCILCDYHYERILQENNGAVPEVTGHTEAAALENLLGVFKAEDDSEIFYGFDTDLLDTCTCCTNDATIMCNKCNVPLCLTCVSYGEHGCSRNPNTQN